MKNFPIVAAILLVCVPCVCTAYEIRSGLVRKVIVNAPPMSNRNVQVEIEGVTQMCTISSNAETGYINKADAPDTFSVFMSTLLTAQSTGRAVVVFTTPGTEGCRIDQIQLASG